VQRHAFLLWLLLLLQAASKDDPQQVINACSKNLSCKLAMCRTSKQKVAVLPYEGKSIISSYTMETEVKERN